MNFSQVDDICTIIKGSGPLIAASIHDGHGVRRELLDIMELTDQERLREEDPFTSSWTTIAETRIIARTSRFEIDLNRPRNKAVYREPEDAWGLKIWKTKPDSYMVQRSLGKYDAFYKAVYALLTEIKNHYGSFVVYDIHSYNHCRGCPEHPPAEAKDNPEVNIGTGTMDRKHWQPLVNRFIKDLGEFDFLGRHLDVRENVKFRGGYFPLWVHKTFPESGCALAIEFKKFFMDELTGVPNKLQIEVIEKALRFTVPGVIEELNKIKARQ
jgi:N-formylglutamate deformylase